MKAKSETTETESRNGKLCSACSEFKSFNEFFKKRLSYESICKCCKKIRRIKPKEETKNPSHGSVEAQVKAAEVPNHANIELKKPADFFFWEEKYKYPLEECDKIEIKNNLRDLISLLKSEYKS